MLSRLDDYPIHQTPEPLAQTASSDRNTYDRFWYNGHDKQGSYYFGIALCRYPNLGIMDCSLSFVVEGRQYAFHGSRRAPEEASELCVGPFRIEILEPMGRHRVVIEDNSTGITCDLLFTPLSVPYQEGRQTTRNARHLVMDATRLDQFGVWEGQINYDGKQLRVLSQDNCGIKDRSWGIRPVGERDSGGAPLDAARVVHFLWLPLHWKKQCTLAGCFESEDGFQWHTDQAVLPRYSEASQVPGLSDEAAQHWQGIVGHDIDFEPGTRRARAATITMNHRDGQTRAISLEPLLVHYMKGLGYHHPEWGHGKWHGELAIGAESWSLADVDPLAFENLHVQQVVRARCGDELAYGVLEQFHLGPHQGLGFEGYFDAAGDA